MKVIREKVIKQPKTKTNQNKEILKQIFEQTINCEYDWINDDEVILKGKPGTSLHKFCLKAEELGEEIVYREKSTIEIGEEESKSFQILNDNIKSQDSKDIISSMIDSIINYYKLQYLRDWERNHNIDKSSYDEKISELTNTKKQLLEQVKEGKEVNIESFINLKIKNN